MDEKLIREVMGDAPNRRSFVRKLGLAGAAGAVILSGAKPVKGQQLSDTDILNFALNLEYLEAEFYTVATTGMTLAQLGFDFGGVGTPGPTTGGGKVALENGTIFTHSVALELAQDEREHVLFLRQALGSAAVAKPAINLSALGTGFGDESQFLALGRDFEDVGVSAYAGAAPLLQNKTFLGYAARILATEAEHVGNVRLQIARLNIATTRLDSKDILPPPSGTQFFSNNPHGLVVTRTPGQVLYFVYGNMANVTAGGFFPNGVNGIINMSSGPA